MEIPSAMGERGLIYFLAGAIELQHRKNIFGARLRISPRIRAQEGPENIHTTILPHKQRNEKRNAGLYCTAKIFQGMVSV
jgi:hypothetical protein